MLKEGFGIWGKMVEIVPQENNSTVCFREKCSQHHCMFKWQSPFASVFCTYDRSKGQGDDTKVRQKSGKSLVCYLFSVSNWQSMSFLMLIKIIPQPQCFIRSCNKRQRQLATVWRTRLAFRNFQWLCLHKLTSCWLSLLFAIYTSQKAAKYYCVLHCMHAPDGKGIESREAASGCPGLLKALAVSKPPLFIYTKQCNGHWQAGVLQSKDEWSVTQQHQTLVWWFYICDKLRCTAWQ